MNPKRANRTMSRIILICSVVACLVVSNVVYTMVTKAHFRSGTNVEAYSSSKEQARTISAKRGTIYDHNKEIIAQDIDTYTIYAIMDSSHTGIGDTPEYVMDPKMTAEKLAPLLDMSVDEIMVYFETAQASDMYQIEFGLKGKALSTTQKEAIDALELPGIEFTKSSKRFYPTGKFASYLIGYAQYDENEQRLTGRMGIEEYLDDQLKGKDGEERYRASAAGTILPGSKHVTAQAVNGNDVYLTLDKNVQVALEKCLEGTMEEFKSQRAWGVVMEVETGKILGYSAYPTFDLNELDIKEYLNVPSEYLYEPGSVMKMFTYASAIDSGNYPANQMFTSDVFYMGIDADGNPTRVASEADAQGTIYDALGTKHGTISFEDGFALSSNIAICEMLTKYLPTNIFENYLDKFGFFKKVGMAGVNEQAGVKNFTWPIEKLTTGFGQGSNVTAMQMMQAASALFNDGNMMKPYYIDKIVNSNTGEVVEQGTPEVVGTPVSKETADQMKELMYRVVNDKIGTGYYRFHMDDVEVIGKTGTGEIATDGKYGKNTYVNSFMAAAPYDDPKVMMYYVFESGDITYSNGEYFKSAFRQALIAAGVSGDNENNETKTTWEEYDMPTLINHSLTYALEKLSSISSNTIIIGDGTSVIKQYPEAQDKVTTKQNVFLLTDGSTITMPEMKDWTLKDVKQFAAITNLNVTWEGSGCVSEQNIKAGDVLTAESELHLVLK